MLTVAVLGPIDVRRDGVRLVVPAGKTTEVLIRLALDAGALVRTDRLIEDLWSASAHGVARNTLQAKVSNLRRALGDAARVTGGAAGYTLAVDPGSVDAVEVLRLADTTAAQRAAGDAAGAQHTSAAALAMFRGELLPDAGDGEWLVPHRARLDEARLRLTEDHLAARLWAGAAGEVIGELETLVAAHPLREGLWALLITALYRAGRQADALGAYRRVRQRLADELGLDPGAELQALEQQVLLHDPSLDRPVGPGPRPADAPVRGNLPGVSASLVGRDADLAAIGRLVGSGRLVTVVGTAGVGKTRLAIEAAGADRSSGGAWLVRLDGTAPGTSVWPGVGAALGLSEATESMVLDRLHGFELLVVLDNCEHLVDTVPDAIGRMLSAAPGLRVLATSQLPLGVPGEQVYPLAPLSIEDSVRLFAQRAARQRSFELDAESGRTVEQVCRSLDGLPLAIELAAARTKVLSVQEIARRLGDRFRLLSDPNGRGPLRRRTLRAAIAWSYDLLFPDDQRGLWALACFAGGAPLAAVEEVLAALDVPAAAVVDVVDRLVDRCLVVVYVDPGDEVRYRLLDSVREFSADRLGEAGLLDVARAAHAGWFAGAAARARLGMQGREQAEHLRVVRTERANIDAALAWTRDHDPGTGLQIANGFGWAWVVLGAGRDAAVRAREALAAAADASARDRVDCLLLAGWFEASGGDLDRATADVEEAIRLAAATGDEALLGTGRLFLAFVCSQRGSPHEALALLADCREEFHRLGLAWQEGAGWLLTAWAEIALGETARGAVACDHARRLFAPLGDDWALVHTEAMSGGLAQARQRFADATAHLGRAADAARHLGFAAAEALHLSNLGRAHQQNGEHPAAIVALRRSIDGARAAGDLRIVALSSVRLGRILYALGRPEQARAPVTAARQWYAAAGGGDGARLADHLAAALDADDGVPGAADRLVAVLAAARQAGDPEIEVLTLDALAHLRAEQGRSSEADALWADADRAMPAAAHLLTDADRIRRPPADR